MPDEIDDDVTEQLDSRDTLDGDRYSDVLDEGWSPPERPWAVDGWGTTWRELAAGEGLDARLARELPDVRDGDDDGIGDVVGTDGEERDDEVGGARAGRLVADDADRDGTVATDVGVDGAGAAAEEAAVHVVDDR